MANGEVITDGGALPKVLDTERIRNTINSCLELADMHKIPVVQEEIQRSHKEGHETGLRSAHVDGLLAALRCRNIWLSSEQKTKLRSMGYAELPTMDAVFDATDADDFAQQAGL